MSVALISRTSLAHNTLPGDIFGQDHVVCSADVYILQYTVLQIYLNGFSMPTLYVRFIPGVVFVQFCPYMPIGHNHRSI